MAIERLSIVGGGWAGLAAAVAGCEAGYEVTLYEASKTLGDALAVWPRLGTTRRWTTASIF